MVSAYIGENLKVQIPWKTADTTDTIGASLCKSWVKWVENSNQKNPEFNIFQTGMIRVLTQDNTFTILGEQVTN